MLLVMSAWPAAASTVEPCTTNPSVRDSGGRRPPREDRLLTEITASVPPRISHRHPGLSPATIALLEHATSEAVGLDRGAATSLGALGGFLLRSESVATSKIERIDAPTDEFARALAGTKAGRAARETAAAAHTINQFVERAGTGSLDPPALLDAHRSLLGDDPHEGHEAGHFRGVQNWVGGNDFTPRGAVYVPPPARLVADLVDDLLAFIDRDDVPALAQAAIAHAQFESIHPFTDGNGRIGRALVNAVLRLRRVTTRTVVPIAAVLLTDTDGYFATLTAYRQGNVEAIISLFAHATFTAASEALHSAQSLAQLPDQWRGRVNTRRGSATAVLLDGLLDTPVLTEKIASARTGVAPGRVYEALGKLTSADVVTEITGQGRNRVWVAHEVLDELDRLQQRIGRRGRPSQPG
jgi:Fic family protein